jgi:hypothetical protein
MANGIGAAARAARQDRVSKVVWGLAFIAAGALLTLHNLGRIDLAPASPHPPTQAVDGRGDTRWSSSFSDPQWITVDLGSTADLQRIKLSWESAHAKAYQLQVSNDGAHWTTVKDVTDGDGAIDEYDVSSSGRYVRMNGVKRATPYGYSLWEFEVYGSATQVSATGSPGAQPSSATLLSLGKAASASSVETNGLWTLYWPVLLLASGLPSLIAPKDVGNMVMGFLLTASGVFFQLRTLGFHSWGFREAVPILFVVAGSILVMHSWRGQNGEPTGGAGSTGCL